MDLDIERVVDRMSTNPEVRRKIRAHLFRQLWLTPGTVRLSDGRVVPEGGEAEGEGQEP